MLPCQAALLKKGSLSSRRKQVVIKKAGERLPWTVKHVMRAAPWRGRRDAFFLKQDQHRRPTDELQRRRGEDKSDPFFSMADSSSLPDMRFYESRKESFILSGTGTNADLAQAQPGRRKASNNKASAAAAPAPLQWPHPIASSATATSAKSQKALYPTPSDLARLGAFYEPLGAEEADRCTIWPEGISVSGWTAGESALDRLRRVDPSVCWVRIEDSRAGGASTEKIDEEQGQARWYEWPASQGHLLPTSNEMYQARHMTFGGLWKYDGKKGWKPTSAKVGFVIHPNDEKTRVDTSLPSSLQRQAFTILPP